MPDFIYSLKKIYMLRIYVGFMIISNLKPSCQMK